MALEEDPRHSEDPQERRSGRTQAIVTLITNGASSVVSLVYGVMAARWFGAEIRGQTVAFMYWPSLLSLVAMLGVPTAASYYAAHQRDRADQIVGTGALIMAASGLVTATVLVATLPLLLGNATPDVVRAGRLFAISVVIQALIGVVYHPLRVVGYFGPWNVIRLLIDSTPLAALVILILLSSRTVVTYAIVMISIQLVVVIIAVAFVGMRIGFRFSRNWVSPLLRYGLPTVLATLPALLNFRVDQAFLVRLVSREQLGNYAAAIAWSQATAVVTNVINYMTLPRVAALRGQERVDEYAHLIRLANLLAVLVAVPLMVLSPVLVPALFGSDFAMAGKLCLVLIPSSTIMGLNSVSEEVLRAQKMLRGPLISQVAGVVMTIAALFVVVPIAGVWGAAVVSGSVYLSVSVILGRFLRLIGLPRTAPFVLPGRKEWNVLLILPRMALDRIRPGTPS